jgi:hypothetical protein
MRCLAVACLVLGMALSVPVASSHAPFVYFCKKPDAHKHYRHISDRHKARHHCRLSVRHHESPRVERIHELEAITDPGPVVVKPGLICILNVCLPV